MAFQSAQNSRVLAGAFSYSPKLTQWSVPSTITPIEVTTIADSAKQFIPGDDTSTLTMGGYFDDDGTAGAFFASVNTWMTTPTGVTVAPSGLALGSELVMVNANQSNVTNVTSDPAANTFTFAAQTDGVTDFGRSLHDLTAETATAVGTGYDNGAATANGGLAQIHVTAFSGFTNIIVLVEHSVDNSVWATLATFSTVTAATSERITIAAGTTVRRYLRSSWTKTGTGSCTFQVGFARR